MQNDNINDLITLLKNKIRFCEIQNTKTNELSEQAMGKKLAEIIVHEYRQSKKRY